MAKGKVVNLWDVQSGLPPLHTNTDSWKLITNSTAGAKDLEFWLTEMRPGAKTEMDTHPFEQVYFIISGRCKSFVGDDVFDLQPDTALFIPKGTPHRLDVIGTETLRFAVVNAPGRPEM